MGGDGRFELGLGAGHMRPEYDQAGIRFDLPSVRIERLGESVAVVKGLLAGEEFSFAGEHYQVTRHRVHPLPAQQPHPPILIGGNSCGVLTLAAREADIVGLFGFGHTRQGKPVISSFTTAGIEQRISWVRETAGERFEALELNALLQAVVVTNDRRGAAADLTGRIPGLSVEDLLDSPFLLIGTPAQMADDLLARRERLGISYYAVFEPAIEALAPVVALLRGR